MNETIHNIFVTVKPSRKLAKVSRHMTVLTLVGIGYAVWSELNCREQNEKIDLLARKIKNLEHGEGE